MCTEYSLKQNFYFIFNILGFKPISSEYLPNFNGMVRVLHMVSGGVGRSSLSSCLQSHYHSSALVERMNRQQPSVDPRHSSIAHQAQDLSSSASLTRPWLYLCREGRISFQQLSHGSHQSVLNRIGGMNLKMKHFSGIFLPVMNVINFLKGLCREQVHIGAEQCPQHQCLNSISYPAYMGFLFWKDF